MKEKCTLDDVISNRDKSDSFTRTSSLTHGYLGAALPDPQIHFYFELFPSVSVVVKCVLFVVVELIP